MHGAVLLSPFRALLLSSRGFSVSDSRIASTLDIHINLNDIEVIIKQGLGLWTLLIKEIYCVRIRRRRGIYGKIWPEPKGVPNMDIISFLKVTLWPFSVLPSEVGYTGRVDSPYVPLWEGNITSYTP